MEGAQPSGPIVSRKFTTDALPARVQLEAWLDWFSPLYDGGPIDPQGGRGFSAENEVWRLGCLIISRVAGPATRFVRQKTHLRRSPVDHWVLTYCHNGESFVGTRRGSSRVPACTPYFWSLGEESEGVRAATERIQLFLPRDSFRHIGPLLDAGVGSALKAPLGGLLGEFMLSLERHLPNLATSDLPRLAGAVGGLVAACVAPSAERLAQAQRQIDFGRMERVRQTVHKHLRSPRLGPDTLCRSVAMSRSQLYRMLEGAGGVARYIQHHRLLEAHRVLCDTAISRPIFAIAEDFCFEDASSFSRAFRREFGASPSDIRAAALAGLVPTAMPMHSAAGAAGSFAELLHSF